MEKKRYIKPSMKVYEIKTARIICTSDGPEFGYVPGTGEDKNHLA